MRRVLLVVIGAIVVLAVVGAASKGGGADPAQPTASEAHIAAVLAGNVKDLYATDDWYPTLQQVNGLPNIQVFSTTAFVFATIDNSGLGKASALTICHSVAAVTNDPDTAQPIGVKHVKVLTGSGKDELASCDTP